MSPLPWFRWHNGTVTDPKWRVVASRADTSVANVVAVWASILEAASQSEERGIVTGWCAEDIAANLGIDSIIVDRVWGALQGKVLDGQQLTGWNKRQPKREDDSGDRVKRYRQRVTHSNAVKRKETNVTQRNARVEESRVDNKHTSATADAEQVSKAIEQQFAEIWSIYPKREGGNPRHDALKSYKARRRTGVDHHVMFEGVQRYASYCHAKGWIQTSFVKQAAVFFGPAEHYLESWEIGSTPPTTNGLGSMHKLVPASEINTNVIDWRKEALES